MNIVDEAAHAIMHSPTVTETKSHVVLGVWDIINPNALTEATRILKGALSGDYPEVYTLAEQVFGPQEMNEGMAWEIRPYCVPIHGIEVEKVLRLCRVPQPTEVV